MTEKLTIILISFALISCASMQSRDIEQITKSQHVLKKYEGKILSPQDDIKDAWANTPKNFSYTKRVIAPTMDLDILETFDLQEIEGDVYLFDYISKGKKKDYQRAYVNGYKHRYENGKLSDLSSMGQCYSYRVGKCEYTQRGRKKTLTTTYEDGIWTQTWIYQGLSGVATYRAIYDKRGLELYSWLVYENKFEPDFHTLFQIVERVE